MAARPALLVRAVAPWVAAFAVVTACSSELTRDDLAQQFVEANDDASTEQAGCVVDELIRQYGVEGLERELEAVPVASSFERAQFKAVFGCGMTDDVQAELAVQLAARGVDTDDAACAAEELTDELDDDDLEVLLTGEITDDFYTKYFVALDRCGAVP